MNEHWQFSKEKVKHEMLTAPESFRDLLDQPLAEVMLFYGRLIADGPVEIDWSDRYGWASLTYRQLLQLLNEAAETLRQWDSEGGI